jgi:atypical dual specificity phosphatase
MQPMSPLGFSWVEPPHLAAMARPDGLAEFQWLREQGIQLLISLTEAAPYRRDLDEAGLLGMHVPVPDFHAPSPEQIDQCVTAILRAKEQKLGIGVHCVAGLGRTGTILASYFVAEGLSAPEAIQRVRILRPGSIETAAQEEAVAAFAIRRRAPS